MTPEAERERLLQILHEAPLEVLLAAVQDFKAHKQRIAADMESALRFFGNGKQKQVKVVEVETPEPVVETAMLDFITPPGTPTSKVGSKIEEITLRAVSDGPKDLQTLSVMMDRPEKVAEGLLARLCQKGVLRYRCDGTYCP